MKIKHTERYELRACCMVYGRIVQQQYDKFSSKCISAAFRCYPHRCRSACRWLCLYTLNLKIDWKLTHCNRCTVYLVLHTYRAHRTALHSRQMNFCMDSLRPAVCNTIRMLLSLDRLRWGCIDMIPVHMPGILSQYIRPYSKRILCCKSFYSVYWSMVDSMACGHRNSLDHGNHYRHGIDRQISMYIRSYSMVLAMGYSWRVVSVCTVFDWPADAMSSGNNKCLCSLLPNHNRILRPDRRHRYRRLLVVVLLWHPEWAHRRKWAKM